MKIGKSVGYITEKFMQTFFVPVFALDVFFAVVFVFFNVEVTVFLAASFLGAAVDLLTAAFLGATGFAAAVGAFFAAGFLIVVAFVLGGLAFCVGFINGGLVSEVK